MYGGPSAILFYQFSWRQCRHLLLPILTEQPTSTPSFFQFPTTSSDTPTSTNPLAALPPSSYTTYLHGGILPPRHLIFHFPTTSCLSQAPSCSVGGVEVPLPHLSFLRHSHTWSSRTSCAPRIHTFSISPLALIRPNSFFLQHSLHLILKGHIFFNSFPSGVTPVAAKYYIRSLT